VVWRRQGRGQGWRGGLPGRRGGELPTRGGRGGEERRSHRWSHGSEEEEDQRGVRPTFTKRDTRQLTKTLLPLCPPSWWPPGMLSSHIRGCLPCRSRGRLLLLLPQRRSAHQQRRRRWQAVLLVQPRTFRLLCTTLKKEVSNHRRHQQERVLAR
jgi:hypothetical protein